MYDGQFSPHRNKTFGIKAENNPGKQFVVFSQNHDQVGNRMLGERTSTLTSFEMQKLLAGAVLVSPYLPMLWMGEEYSEPNPFFYFVSHTDPELAEAVRKGRKAEFAAFHAAGEAPDPMAIETFNQSKLQWDLLQQEPHQTMFRYYQTLIKLRQEQPALKTLNRKNLEVTVKAETNTLTLHRWEENNHVVCFMNFSGSQEPISLPGNAQQWQKILDSADPQWNGPLAAPETIGAHDKVPLQPESILVYISR